MTAMAYKVPADIGNRAIQHCGGTRMDPVLGFNENSRNASEVAFAYDKQRETELQQRSWTFAVRRTILRAVDINTMRLQAALWQPITTYFVGSIVSDVSGNFWISNVVNNLGNDPLLTTVWEPYFGPLSVTLYDATIAYLAGELVYTAAGDGTSRVYMSLQSGNSDNPATATPWSATTSYFKNMVVTFASVAYMSLIDLNTNQQPSLSPANWSAVTTYTAAQKVGGSDGVIYQSIAGANLGNDPTLTAGFWTNTGVLNPWTTVFVGGLGSDKWLQIGGKEFPSGVALSRLNVIYPLGTGPSNQTTTKNIFVLPAGYLRKASQAPKTGLNPLGGPSGIIFDDWLIENGCLVSSEIGPITLRFVANFTDVARMHTLFCEGVAARLALAIVDTITQDKGQMQLVAKVFKEWEDKAKVVDAIEDEFTDSPDDDYLTVRL